MIGRGYFAVEMYYVIEGKNGLEWAKKSKELEKFYNRITRYIRKNCIKVAQGTDQAGWAGKHALERYKEGWHFSYEYVYSASKKRALKPDRKLAKYRDKGR